MQQSYHRGIEDFWLLIEESERNSLTRSERVEWLQGKLVTRAVEEIVEFQAALTNVRRRAYTSDLYGAFYNVLDEGSLDGFEYFNLWLVSLGRMNFEAVVGDPDKLIDLPQIQYLLDVQVARLQERKSEIWSREERPQFEILGYVAYDPYETVSGRPAESLFDAVRGRGDYVPLLNLTGEAWKVSDPVQVQHRLPRIYNFMKRYRRRFE
ncbi:DUF4240 domain-containing protein [Nonomuraea sp. NPDC046802]|uniref:DUF4240 domain-containing protein n=1 Tax=Nonomuraea sp. NPDC046802 TaxID=3154919 RepID=UPI0033C6E855